MGAKLDGGGGGKRGSLPVNSDPNVIPFIDVMLVLLIIFMVAAPIATVDITASLPKSEVLASQRVPKPVWVTLVDGADCDQPVKGRIVTGACPRVYVMEDQTTWDSIGDDTMAALRKNNPRIREFTELIDQRIYVRASGETRYGNVMRVMNRLQDQGLTKIALVQSDSTP